MNNFKNIFDLFSLYVKTRIHQHPASEYMLKLKYDHSLNVYGHMAALSQALDFDETEALEAQIGGLLHDAGRFEQYILYHTFVDSRSVDHAQLGCTVIQRERWLQSLNRTQEKRILNAIAQHSLLHIDSGLDEQTLMLAQMLRDCDKIDILRLVAEYYTDLGRKRHRGIELDLPDDPEISSKVVETFLGGQIVNKADLKTLNDFKVLQMGWVNDLNFAWTRQYIARQGYIVQIFNTLPESQAKTRISRALHCVQGLDVIP